MTKKFIFESFEAYLSFTEKVASPLYEKEEFEITKDQVEELVKKILEKQKEFLKTSGKFKDYLSSSNPYETWLKDWKKNHSGESFPAEGAGQKQAGAFAAVYMWDKLSEDQKNDLYTSMLIDLEERGFNTISEIEKIVKNKETLLSLPYVIIVPTETVEKITQEKYIPGGKRSLLKEEDETRLFKDNEWELKDDSFQTPELKKKITEEIDNVVRGFANNYLEIKSITIQSSCSRYRNTGDAINLSWGELSYQRSLSVSKIFGLVADKYGLSAEKKEELRNLIKLDYKGSNGDGTSGPNPLEPAKYGYYDKNSKFIENNGKFNSSRTTVVVSNLGPEGKPTDTLETAEIELGKSKEDYEQYKYVNVVIEISRMETVDPISSTETFTVTKTEYSPGYRLPLKDNNPPKRKISPPNPPIKRLKVIGIPGIGTGPDKCPVF